MVNTIHFTNDTHNYCCSNRFYLFMIAQSEQPLYVEFHFHYVYICPCHFFPSVSHCAVTPFIWTRKHRHWEQICYFLVLKNKCLLYVIIIWRKTYLLMKSIFIPCILSATRSPQISRSVSTWVDFPLTLCASLSLGTDNFYGYCCWQFAQR